jgi:hypothetical protein
MSAINWDRGEWTPTWFRGMLPMPWGFEETVARLITLSGQDPTKETDGYKVSVQFVGRFKGNSFSLYDYKEDRAIHIGGTDALAVGKLADELIKALEDVQPTGYIAKEYYDIAGRHSWP